jgi:hypothetical protein
VGSREAFADGLATMPLVYRPVELFDVARPVGRVIEVASACLSMSSLKNIRTSRNDQHVVSRCRKAKLAA